MEGVSPSQVLVPAQSKSRRLAANACWAACVRMADQRERREASTALRRMLGTALAFVWAKRRKKMVASGLHRPPVSRASICRFVARGQVDPTGVGLAPTTGKTRTGIYDLGFTITTFCPVAMPWKLDVDGSGHRSVATLFERILHFDFSMIAQ